MSANLSAIFYLISGVLFILALRGLSSPETSRRGNFFGILGMIIAITVTFLSVGNFSSGFTPVKIAQLDTGSVSNREVSITTAVLQGTGNYRTTISGYTNQNSGTFFTPSSTKNMRAPAATEHAACYNSATNDVYTSVEFRVKATGYNTKVFNKFISILAEIMTVSEKLNELKDIFNLFDNPKDKYIQLMDMGRKTQELLPEERNDKNKIYGCLSHE